MLPKMAVLGLALVAGACERIGFYSIGGESDAPETSSSGSGDSGNSVGSGSGVSGSARRRALASMASCAEDAYVSFGDAADTLAKRVDDYVASPNDASRDSARAAWIDAMAAWQQTEPIGVGPAAPASSPAGEGLRDLVYSWPLVSRCLVEQTLVARAYETDTFSKTALINQRGLAVLEYLLFSEGDDNACGPTSSINAQGTWAALGPSELAERKRSYAAVVAADVADEANAIARGWASSGGGFADELATAGAGSKLFASDQAALNAVTDGLFYVDKQLKDLKLGKPLGLYECTESSCPDFVESQYARVARSHVRNNLVGAQRLLAGCEGAEASGLVGLLRELGATELADRLEGQLADALAATDALPTDDLIVAIATDRPRVEALHTTVKTLSATLKTELMTVLDLEPPLLVEGDND